MQLHPEATADPTTLRWVTDAVVPEDAVATLLCDDALAAVDIGPGEIRTRLAPGYSWAADGPRVRTVLFEALSRTVPRDLPSQIAALLAREVGTLVSSHGGVLHVVSVREDVVEVALEGACGHCALRNRTLTRLVADTVRAEFPEIREVRAVRT
ncbi:NifU family protein [Mycobacterium sp. 141]|uniref:NifU family protein n=1 Tax=Mycobacterium sp. 141 TaxID=1120797 RepID=UPI00039E8FF1|nr:NifU family protein [Mycobacterium sp. 141]